MKVTNHSLVFSEMKLDDAIGTYAIEKNMLTNVSNKRVWLYSALKMCCILTIVQSSSL